MHLNVLKGSGAHACLAIGGQAPIVATPSQGIGHFDQLRRLAVLATRGDVHTDGPAQFSQSRVTDAIPGEIAVLATAQNTRAVHVVQMTGNIGLGGARFANDVGYGTLLVTQSVQDSNARGFGEQRKVARYRLKNLVEVFQIVSPRNHVSIRPWRVYRCDCFLIFFDYMRI